MAPLLEIRDLVLRFGGIPALAGVSLDLAEGETLALIGPNGSGKTSLFNCVTGLYRPTAGRVEFAGESLLGCPPDRVAARGIARTFQNLRLFPSLTVLDNLMVGRHRHFERRFLDAVLRRGGEEARQRARCEEVLELLRLDDWRGRRASDCPYGVQKRVEIARALASEPRLLLLDEPASGLSGDERDEMAGQIHDVHARFGTTVLVVEHDLGLAARLARRMVALEEGRAIAEGTPDEVRRHPAVVRAFLGDAPVAS